MNEFLFERGSSFIRILDMKKFRMGALRKAINIFHPKLKSHKKILKEK